MLKNGKIGREKKCRFWRVKEMKGQGKRQDVELK